MRFGCSRFRDDSSLVEEEGRDRRSRSQADRSKLGLQGAGGNPTSHSYLGLRLGRSAEKILKFQVPRGLAPSYGLGATDYRSPTGDGDKPDYLTSVVTVSREGERRFCAGSMLGGMEVRGTELPARPREHDSCRSRPPQVSSRTSDLQDPGVSSAQLEIGVSRPVTQQMWDCRASKGEDVDDVGARKVAQSE